MPLSLPLLAGLLTKGLFSRAHKKVPTPACLVEEGKGKKYYLEIQAAIMQLSIKTCTWFRRRDTDAAATTFAFSSLQTPENLSGIFEKGMPVC